MKKYTLLLISLLLISPTSLFAASKIESIIQYYQGQGGLSFSADAGNKLWHRKVAHRRNPTTRSCTSCHGNDLTKRGRHIKTHKVIQPMAISVNPNRFTKLKKVEKWFMRNCKAVWKRKCTTQEKGDILRYLSQQ